MSGIISTRYSRVRLSFGLLFFILVICLFPGVSIAQEWATSGANIYNTNSGNVGIGTMGPSSTVGYGGPLLHLNGSQPALVLQNTSGGAAKWEIGTNWIGSGNTPTLTFGVSPNYAMAIQSTGNIGIGTTSPTSKLHIYSTDVNIFSTVNIETTQNSLGSQVRLATPGGDYSLSLQRYGTAASGNYPHLGGTVAYTNSANLFALLADNFLIGTHGSLHFTTGGTSYYRMSILNNGNVGIGTTNPQEQLHVTGNVRVDGNIAAKYQDVAEWVYSPMLVDSGTVVVLDARDINRVIPSSASYDTRVAGVVSDTPGILLGEGGDGKVKVATTGRVKVKADATHRPINAGDLLVTSDSEGYAMRSEPLDLGGIAIHRPGTILGKALEPLNGGKGEILVLLTLQ